VEDLPVIDVSALVRGEDDRATAVAIDAACRNLGFFYAVGHGVDEDRQVRLEQLAHELFALDPSAKAACAMDHGGPAWRGWFPLGGELTSGRPDTKEGWYFGAELGADHPRVRAGTPLHGPNVFPAELPELRPVLLAHLDAMTALGHALVRGIALGLGLAPDWFDRHLTADPLVLFRIFRYPPTPEPDPADEAWGVAEHTDYGLLTMLRQDAVGGLQVHGPDGWIEAPPVPGSFVCNLGDMLERMTGGRYRSTPHRVRNTGTTDRLSFPFFFDPDWDAEVRPVPTVAGDQAPARPRWDGSDLEQLTGTYGEYLMSKVGKVFPALSSNLHPDL
jgi:isopenicillin N synthase-like dioxygenase